MESLTDNIESQIDAYIQKIDNLGGTLAAIESNFVQREIHQSSYRFQKEIENNERVYVGINKYMMEEPPPENLLKVDMNVGQLQEEKLRSVRSRRDRNHGAGRWNSSRPFPFLVRT